MNHLAHRTLFKVVTILSFFFPACLAQAADKPVDATNVVGHWVLSDVKTEDAETKKQIAEHKLEMTFRADKTVVVSATEKNEKPQIRTATYRVADGKIIIKAENEPSDEPVKAVIREGKLVLLPPDGSTSEFVFSKAAK